MTEREDLAFEIEAAATTTNMDVATFVRMLDSLDRDIYQETIDVTGIDPRE